MIKPMIYNVPMELINALLQQATAQGTKSTVLKPLGWALAILISGSVGSFGAKAPFWLGLTLLVLACLTCLLYLGSYIYFMRHDPDALRSEKYSLKKLEIQRGLVGDHIAGVISEGEVIEHGRLETSRGSESEGGS